MTDQTISHLSYKSSIFNLKSDRSKNKRYKNPNPKQSKSKGWKYVNTVTYHRYVIMIYF